MLKALSYTICILVVSIVACESTGPDSGDPFPQNVVTTIPTGISGDIPTGICALNSGDYVYVPSDMGMLYVIRTNDNTVVSEVDITPGGMQFLGGACVDDADQYVYVLNVGSNNVIVVRTVDNGIETTIPLGYDASENEPCFISAISRLYVPCEFDDVVVVIDTEQNVVVDAITVGDQPRGICSDPTGSYVYVPNWMDNTVSVIRTLDNAVIAEIEVGNGPVGVSCLLNGQYVFITCGTGVIDVLRTSDNVIVKSFPVGSWPNGMCLLLPDGNYMYVTNRNDHTVSVVSTSEQDEITTIGVGWGPFAICSVPSRGYLYVANSVSEDITVIGE